jgi:glycosyltransferase involved in cell wall biosynthesis
MYLSVILCTHNPRPEYLRRVLDALKAQTLAKEQWELLLIDNASKEPLANSWDLSWHPLARHIREDELGLTPARLRGIGESTGDLLVFVDDDNVLFPTYLLEASRVYEHHPALGAWNGQLHAEFECTPPEWTKDYWHMLAIRPLEADRWSNLVEPPVTIPCGAGMCVRRKVANHYLELVHHDERRSKMDRKGQMLTSSGDTDLALCAHDLGLGTGLFKALELTHLIPAGRLEEAYLLRLAEFARYSEVLLKGLRGYRPSTIQANGLRRLLGSLRRRFTLPSHKRKFVEASFRGYWRGVAEISTWKSNSTTKKSTD